MPILRSWRSTSDEAVYLESLRSFTHARFMMSPGLRSNKAAIEKDLDRIQQQDSGVWWIILNFVHVPNLGTHLRRWEGERAQWDEWEREAKGLLYIGVDESRWGATKSWQQPPPYPHRAAGPSLGLGWPTPCAPPDHPSLGVFPIFLIFNFNFYN
jgi:hypothetical protein